MTQKRRHTGGRPPSTFVGAALNAIRESSHPLSTRDLIVRFGLSEAKEMTLRRALRREALLGRLLCVGQVLDGTYAWAPVKETAADDDRALLGAAYAAQAYLRDRMGGEIGLDIETCKQVIASTLTRRSD